MLWWIPAWKSTLVFLELKYCGPFGNTLWKRTVNFSLLTSNNRCKDHHASLNFVYRGGDSFISLASDKAGYALQKNGISRSKMAWIQNKNLNVSNFDRLFMHWIYIFCWEISKRCKYKQNGPICQGRKKTALEIWNDNSTRYHFF